MIEMNEAADLLTVDVLDYDNMAEEPPGSRARGAMEAMEAKTKAMKALF